MKNEDEYYLGFFIGGGSHLFLWPEVFLPEFSPQNLNDFGHMVVVPLTYEDWPSGVDGQCGGSQLADMGESIDGVPKLTKGEWHTLRLTYQEIVEQERSKTKWFRKQFSSSSHAQPIR